MEYRNIFRDFVSRKTKIITIAVLVAAMSLGPALFNRIRIKESNTPDVLKYELSKRGAVESPTVGMMYNGFISAGIDLQNIGDHAIAKEALIIDYLPEGISENDVCEYSVMYKSKEGELLFTRFRQVRQNGEWQPYVFLKSTGPYKILEPIENPELRDTAIRAWHLVNTSIPEHLILGITIRRRKMQRE